jgi:protocatechuate 3,4-dioxygenase beta subunit
MLSAVASAQASGVISGTVTDADNRPLPGVTVTLASSDDSLRRSIVTNANGRYEIVDLAAGTYTVTAELVGFRPAAKRQRVTSGRREVWLVMELGELPETLATPARPSARIVPLGQER